MLKFWRDSAERQLSALNAAIKTLQEQMDRDAQSPLISVQLLATLWSGPDKMIALWHACMAIHGQLEHYCRLSCT